MKFLVISLAMFIPVSFALASKESPSLTDFSLFAIQNLTATAGDSQGSIGAGGSVSLLNFKAAETRSKVGIFSKGNLDYINGQTDGTLHSSEGSVTIDHVEVAGDVTAYLDIKLKDSSVLGKAVVQRGEIIQDNGQAAAYSRSEVTPVRFDAINSEILGLSQKLATYTSGAASVAVAHRLKLEAKKDLSEFHIGSVAFNSVKEIKIIGTPKIQIVINVSGETIDWNHCSLSLEGGVTPEQITWNFPNALAVSIQQVGSSTLGIPGLVLAAFAQVNIQKVRVTGHIFARDLAAKEFSVRSTP